MKFLIWSLQNIRIYIPWAHKRLSYCCRSSISFSLSHSLFFCVLRNEMDLKTQKIPPNSDYIFQLSILYYMIHNNNSKANKPFFCVEKFHFILNNKFVIIFSFALWIYYYFPCHHTRKKRSTILMKYFFYLYYWFLYKIWWTFVSILFQFIIILFIKKQVLWEIIINWY